VGQGDPLDLFISAGFGQAFAAAPKVLGDLFESIAGAVYVDSGGDLDVLWKVGPQRHWIAMADVMTHGWQNDSWVAEIGRKL